jgi:hypothetical protein
LNGEALVCIAVNHAQEVQIAARLATSQRGAVQLRLLRSNLQAMAEPRNQIGPPPQRRQPQPAPAAQAPAAPTPAAAPQTITEAKLAELTLFTARELRGLALAGFIPKAAGGSYPLTQSIQGCFKARKQQLTEALPPAFESMAQCTAATGIPHSVLKAAKTQSGAFKAHRIQLVPLLRWLFSKNGDDQDWGDTLKKYQALREEIRYQQDKDQAVAKDEVAFAINKVMAVLFATLDRRADQLPGVLHGMDAPGIKRGLVESNEALKVELRVGFSGLFQPNGESKQS